MRADLSTAEAARSRLEARYRRLEEEAALRHQQLPTACDSGLEQEGSEAAVQAEVLRREAERLRGEKAVAREECRRLRQQAAQDAAEIEHLTCRLQQASGGGQRRGISPVKCTKMAAARDCTAAPAQRSPPSAGCTSQVRQQQQQPAELGAKAGIGSPIEEPAGDGTPSAAPAATETKVCSHKSRPGSSPGSARLRRQAARTAGSPASARPREAAGGPSPEEQRQFRRELSQTLHNAERPGVVCRFPHSLGSFLALRPDLEVGGRGTAGQMHPSTVWKHLRSARPRDEGWMRASDGL